MIVEGLGGGLSAELVRSCGVMCAPTEGGGTHPVIVEGMAAGAALLVSAPPPRIWRWWATRSFWDACADAYLRLCDAVRTRARRST